LNISSIPKQFEKAEEALETFKKNNFVKTNNVSLKNKKK
jgi:hypothetical protein